MPHPDTLCREEVESARAMSEIPEDIRHEALKVLVMIRRDTAENQLPEDRIARALLAERQAQRERDAKIADSWRETALACKKEADDDAGRLHQSLAADMADDIADTIRNGTDAPDA